MIPVEFIYPGIPTAQLVEMIRALAYDDRDYDWNPSLHPRDRHGRFRRRLSGPGLIGISASHVPNTSLSDAEERFESEEYAELRTAIRNLAEKHGLKERDQPAVGFWMGEMEPSSLVTWDGDEGDATEYAEELGKLFDQDAVALFTWDPDADGARYLISHENRADAVERIADLGIEGAAITETQVVLYDMDGSDHERALTLARLLFGHLDLERGHVKFLSKGVDYVELYSEHGEEGDNGADPRSREGGWGHGNGHAAPEGWRRSHPLAWREEAEDLAYAWDPKKHPRNPKGSKLGGKFRRRLVPWAALSMPKSEFPDSEATMGALTPEEQEKVRLAWEAHTGVSAADAYTHMQDIFDIAIDDPDAREAGKVWYSDVHDWADEMAEEHGLDLETVAGVIAAMSPMTEWDDRPTGALGNKSQANLLIQYRSRDPEHFDSLPPAAAFHEAREWAVERGYKWPMGAGRSNGIRASEILQGMPVDEALTGTKMRSFYNCIAEPDNPYDVCIDSHMINVAYGGKTEGVGGILVEVSKPQKAKAWGEVMTPEGESFIARKPFSWFGSPKARGRDIGVIPLLADAVRSVTEKWNAEHPDEPLTPLQAQAIIWVEWLKLHPSQQKRKAVKAAQKATEAAALAAMA